MRQFGLIGYPLSHSFSKKFFTEKFQHEGLSQCHYELFPINNIEQVSALIKNSPLLEGLNVTIPYKESVIPLLDELQGAAASIRAVNTIKIVRSSDKIKLIGYNTDAVGFEKAIKPFLKPWHTTALVLGNGGAAKAVCHTLSRLGISWRIVSRNTEGSQVFSYNEISEELVAAHTLIVNTTPLGMFPNTDSCPPIGYEFVREKHLLFDLVYNPEITKFMEKGLLQGADTSNGLSMLHFQALEAWDIWNS